MAVEDPYQAEVSKELESKQKSQERKRPLGNLPTSTRLLIGFGIGVAVWAIWASTLGKTQQIGLLIGFGVMMIIFVGYDSEASDGKLTERELASKAWDILKWEQTHHYGGHYRVPKGKIKLDIIGGTKWLEGAGQYYERKVIIKPTYGLAKEYSMRQDLYTGEMTGFMLRREGFTGKEVEFTDRWIKSPTLVMESKYEKEKKKWG